MKDNILRIITTVMILVLFICGSALDSNSVIPVIGCTVAMVYLTIFAYANGILGGFRR